MVRLYSLNLFNYKRFKTQEINFADSLTVLIGRNNAGKSSVLEAVRMVFDLGHSRLPIIHLHKNLKVGTVVIDLKLKLSIQDWLKVLPLVEHRFPESTFDYQQIASQIQNEMLSIHAELSYVNGIITNSSRTVRLVSPKNTVSLGSPVTNLIQTSLENLQNQNMHHIFGIFHLEAERKIKPNEEFVPMNRLRTTDEKNEYIRNYLFNLKRNEPSKYDELVKKFIEIFGDVEKIECDLNTDTGIIDTQLYSEGHPASIMEMGSGLKSLLFLATRMLDPNVSLILLDEPDLNLHHELMRHLARFLEQTSKNTQIIMTTHNENFMDLVDRTSILHVKSIGKLESEIVALEDKDGRQTVLEDLGIFPSNSELFEIKSSGFVIFGEGPDDWEYIQEFALKLGKSAELISKKPKYIDLGGSRFIQSDVLDRIISAEFPFVLIRDRDEYDVDFWEKEKKKIGDNRLHVWNRREFENYVIDAEAILETLKEKSNGKDELIRQKIQNLTLEDIKKQIKILADEFKTKIIILKFLRRVNTPNWIFNTEFHDFIERNRTKNYDDIVNDYYVNIVQKSTNKTTDQLKDIIMEQKKEIENNWNYDGIIKLCLGKELLSSIMKWISNEFKISTSTSDIIKRIRIVDADVIELIKKITNH